MQLTRAFLIEYALEIRLLLAVLSIPFGFALAKFCSLAAEFGKSVREIPHESIAINAGKTEDIPPINRRIFGSH